MNVVQAWCAWSGMQIRLDKCVTFGMMKRTNVYMQIEPALNTADGQILAVGPNEEFTYLGRQYSFDMHENSAKVALEQKLSRLLNVTNALKVRAQLKLKNLSLYIHSQLMFEIKLYDFPLTWVEQSLDALCISYVRDWLELPVSACVNETLTLPINTGLLGILSFKHLAQKWGSKNVTQCIDPRLQIFNRSGLIHLPNTLQLTKSLSDTTPPYGTHPKS